MSIFCREQGDGAPVVLIHGLGASHRAFEPLMALGGYRFLAFDLPGVGMSGRWATSAPHKMARALSSHLSSIGLTRYRLFGHSFGGLVALSLAAQQPESIERLVIANAPALGLSAEAKGWLKHPMFETTAKWLSRASLPVPKAIVRGYLQWLWGDARLVTDAAVNASVENSQTSNFIPQMLECLRAVAEYQLPAAELKAASFSKRVLWGERDRLVSVIEGERLAIAIDAKLTVLPGVGHSLPEEAPVAAHDALA